MLGHGIAWLLLGNSLLVPDAALAAQEGAPVAGSEQEGAPVAGSGQDSRGALVVEVEPSVADAEEFPGWLMRRHPELVERLPKAPGHEQWISVKIGGTTYDYRVTVTAMRDGAAVGSGGAEFSCECVNRMLFERVDEEIGRAVEVLQAAAAEEEVVAESTPAQTEHGEEEHQSNQGNDVARIRNLGPLGYAGVGVGAFGAGVLAGGVVLFLRESYDFREHDGVVQRRMTRAPGLILIVGGAVAMVGGIVALSVAGARHRQRRVAIIPSVNARLMGLTVGGEF